MVGFSQHGVAGSQAASRLAVLPVTLMLRFAPTESRPGSNLCDKLRLQSSQPSFQLSNPHCNLRAHAQTDPRERDERKVHWEILRSHPVNRILPTAICVDLDHQGSAISKFSNWFIKVNGQHLMIQDASMSVQATATKKPRTLAFRIKGLPIDTNPEEIKLNFSHAGFIVLFSKCMRSQNLLSNTKSIQICWTSP